MPNVVVLESALRVLLHNRNARAPVLKSVTRQLVHDTIAAMRKKYS